MKKRRLSSLILTMCMVLSLVPTVAYATEVENGGAPVKVTTLDNSVDASSICVSLNMLFRDKETGEEELLEGIDTITPENVNVGTFETVKTNAIEDAKAKLNEYLEMTRKENPDVKLTVVGDMDVEGDAVPFDNRTYTMKNYGDDDIIIGDEVPGGTTGGNQTSSRYMQIDGDYGKTGIYSVTMTVEVQAVGDTPSYDIIAGANGVWTQSSDGTLTFRANGDLNNFTGVKVDGTLIDAKNYTAVSGSTVITLKTDYLKTLPAGAHTLTVVYTDGECSTNFVIQASQNTGMPDIPNTSNNSSITLWIALLFISGAGALGTTVYSRKKKYSE
ncbi:MAG: X2-like carbohydrate binding domain-containing protein [Candidatus Fimenecus sp.]